MKKLVPRDAILIPDMAQCVFKGVIYDTYQWPQKLYDGSIVTFEMLRRPDTVAAVCVVDDKLLVVDDEQPNRGKMLTFPGGRVDPGESTLEAIKRELREETGYSFRNWRLVQVRQHASKIEWFIYLFVAWNVEGQAAPDAGPGEKITVLEKSFAEVKQLVQQSAGFLGESRDVFEQLDSISDLLALPVFTGLEVVDHERF